MERDKKLSSEESERDAVPTWTMSLEHADPVKLALMEYARQGSKRFWRLARDGYRESGRGVMLFGWVSEDTLPEVDEEGTMSLYVPISMLSEAPLPPEAVEALTDLARAYKPSERFVVCILGADGITIGVLHREAHRSRPLRSSRTGEA